MLTPKDHCHILQRLMPLTHACAAPTVLLTFVFPAQAAAAAPGNPTAYVRKETQYAWECIQKECQKVLAMLLQGQTGTTPVSMQSDKLGRLACTTKFDLHCTCLHVEGVCKPAVPSQDSFLTMTPISLSPIAGLLHSTSNIECILCNSLRCIFSLSSVVLPKVDVKAKQSGTLPGRQHQLSYLFPAQLQDKQSAAKPSIQCRRMSWQLQSQNRVCWQVDG